MDIYRLDPPLVVPEVAPGALGGVEVLSIVCEVLPLTAVALLEVHVGDGA